LIGRSTAPRVALRCLLAFSLVAAVAAAGQLGVSPRASQARADTASGTAGLFVPTQGTVLDTRTGIGGVSGPVAANTWYPVQITGQAGIPTAGVSSVQVSISVLTPTATGLVKLAPNGTAVVPIAALTYTGGGGSISASSIVAVASDGKIEVLAQTSVTLLVHVQGYYTAGNGAPSPGGYVPVNPARLIDTRNGTGLPQTKLATGSTTAITIGGNGNVPADASAVFVMLTAISTSSTAGYLSPYPTGTTRPGNVSLNYLASTATILGAAVDLGTGGQFNLWVGPAGTAIDVIVDVIGYYTAVPGTGGAFTAAATRVYDSRLAPNVTLPANSSRVVPVGGIAGIPLPTDDASAYTLSAQIVHAGSGSGSLALGPGDESSSTEASVYFSAGSNVRSNLVVVPSGADGTVLLVNSSPDSINVILDVEGWYLLIRPAAPAVSSSSLTDGGTVPSPATAADLSFQSTPVTPTNTQAASYRYWLDDADAVTVPASVAASVSLPAVSDGIHDLLVVAVDAAGNESEATTFSWVVGDGRTPASDDPAADGPPLATMTTTVTTTTTNDDGTTTTTTDTSSADTPAENTAAPFDGSSASQLSSGGRFTPTPANYPGTGGSTYRQLSCAKERVVWVRTSYAQLAVRYNCHYGRGTINWDHKLAPELPGRVVSDVYENGMKWERTGVLGTIRNQKNQRHLEPLDYLLHGSVDTPARPGDAVTASDTFSYMWRSARQTGDVTIRLDWRCLLVP
jgi:hypothetical protein